MKGRASVSWCPMKQKSDPKNGRKLQDLRRKALRRGKRMVNTLRKLSKRSASHDVWLVPLLKDLEHALPHLNRTSDQKHASNGAPGANGRNGAERVAKASRKTRPKPNAAGVSASSQPVSRVRSTTSKKGHPKPSTLPLTRAVGSRPSP